MGTVAAQASSSEARRTLSARLPRLRVIAANVLGALLVYLYLALISPTDGVDESYAIEFGAVAVYLLIAAIVALRRAERDLEPVARWLDADRPPSPEELD